MPKGKRKSKGGSDKRRSEPAASDEDSLNDNGSITSSISEIRSIYDDGGPVGCIGEQEVDDQLEQDTFEEKLKEAIDGISQKSAQGRKSCLESISKAFCSRYIYDFVVERRLTITDAIERCLKKGKGEEQGLAAQVASLLCIQLGAGPDGDMVFKELKQTLLALVADNSVSCSARAKCFTSLGLCTFITDAGQEFIAEIMSALETVFSASYLKGNGAVPSHVAEVSALHSSALWSWSLLLTLLGPSYLDSLVDRHLYRFPELLESPDVDLRIMAGDAIAIFYEVMREGDESFEGDDIDELCCKLKELATDGNKYRAKKDRKQQRSSFRDILKLIEERERTDIQIKFGREILVLDSWCRKRQYDAFCQILGSGMNVHLAENPLIREVFELGTPLVVDGAAVHKATKFERHMVNVAAFRARTVAMNKVRDKRAVIF